MASVFINPEETVTTNAAVVQAAETIVAHEATIAAQVITIADLEAEIEALENP